MDRLSEEKLSAIPRTRSPFFAICMEALMTGDIKIISQ
jgi:hypothetical protein